MFFAPAGSSAKLLVATDVVANQIGVDPAVTDPFALRLEQGVLDTNAEALLMTERPTASNAGWAYAASSSGWATLRSVNDPQLASLKLPDDTRRRIGEDLAAGYVVVAPNAPVAIGTDAFSGWWRIDPRTGQSLGMGGSGWGQDMVEYVIIAATAFGLGFLFQYMWCRISGAGGAPAVANACEPGRRGPRPSLDGSSRDAGLCDRQRLLSTGAFCRRPVGALGTADGCRGRSWGRSAGRTRRRPRSW